jgi:hypothetical protein
MEVRNGDTFSAFIRRGTLRGTFLVYILATVGHEIAIRYVIAIPSKKIQHREKLDHNSRQERQATHDKTETLSYFK